MAVYAISDLHGNLPAIPEDCDVLLIAGDICPDYAPTSAQHWDFIDKTGVRQAGWLDTTFRDWITPLTKRGGQVVAIWGNHDFVGEYPGLVPKLPWTLLRDTGVKIEREQGFALAIWGTPWVPTLTSWAFYGSSAVLQGRADAIPRNIDVLMTHGPPYGACDRVANGTKVGDSTLNQAINRSSASVVICGHIHEARGTGYCHGKVVRNVSAVDDLYRLDDSPFVRIYN